MPFVPLVKGQVRMSHLRPTVWNYATCRKFRINKKRGENKVTSVFRF